MDRTHRRVTLGALRDAIADAKARIKGYAAKMPTPEARRAQRIAMARLESLRGAYAAISDAQVTDTTARMLIIEIVQWHGARGQQEARKYARVDPDRELATAVERAAEWIERTSGGG